MLNTNFKNTICLIQLPAMKRIANLLHAARQKSVALRKYVRNYITGIFLARRKSIVEQLVKENFIDEARYCRAFAQDQFRFSGWGRIKIGYTLRQKQIDPLTVSQSMKVIDETEYTEALRRILKSKCRGLKAVDPSLQGDKLMRFAVSRGFEIDLIKKCLRELSLECTVGSEI